MEEASKTSEKKAKVYAIIVTYNSADWIEECLRSLESSEYPVKIIVVDNASEDKTVEKVSRFPSVRCLLQKKNLGFGLGNNLAISLALREGADYVFLLNPDARVRPDTIGKLVKFASEHKQFGVLAPFHLNGEGSRIEHWFAHWIMQGAEGFYSDLYFGKVKEVYPIRFMNAAAWLLSRDCLTQVGGFDPLFFPAYCEDDDLCERLAYHGIYLGVVSSAIVRHFKGRNTYRSRDLVSDLDNSSNRIKNSIILRFKNPFRPFVRQYLAWNVDIFCDGLRLIFHLNFYGLITLIIASLKILILLPRILRHRQISLASGTHWLDVD